VADSLTIDRTTLPVERPASVADLCALVQRVRGAKHGLYPVGGRTTLALGSPPLKPGVACDLTALSGVIDYPARDMTITVRAGTTIAAIQAELAKEGQWLPIDVASPEKATIGGAVATNASGPRRLGYGTLRDYVIGISFVTDDGTEVKAGGRVVKNVAGYDLMKLQIGALGTLGVVTQLTLKVKPKPEASTTIACGCDSASLGAVLDKIAASKTRPVAVELLNREACRAANIAPADGEWTILVAFEESAAAVKWQAPTLSAELTTTPVTGITSPPDKPLFAALTALQRRPESRFVGKVGALPSKVAETVAKLPASAPVHAHALTGVIWFHSAESLPEGTQVRRGPAKARTPSPDVELMRHVKKTLDPDNVFNPGRLFGDV
jgi:glycolate oxidase FAD binding subunit